MNEVKTEYTTRKGEMAQTRPDARRKRFPANAVVCLYHAELSTTYDTAVKKHVRLIIRLRESDLGPQSPGAAAASFPSRASEHFGHSDTDRKSTRLNSSHGYISYGV